MKFDSYSNISFYSTITCTQRILQLNYMRSVDRVHTCFFFFHPLTMFPFNQDKSYYGHVFAHAISKKLIFHKKMHYLCAVSYIAQPPRKALPSHGLELLCQESPFILFVKIALLVWNVLIRTKLPGSTISSLDLTYTYLFFSLRCHTFFTL